MFKKHTAIGCIGLLLLPILPFVWVFKGYSGNKKVTASILYGSAILSFSIIGYQWHSASKTIQPFIEASSSSGIDFSVRQIGTSNGQKYITVISDTVYEPTNAYASVEEMLEVIQKEKIESIAEFYPDSLEKGSIIKIALHTKSGFIAVFEVDEPGNISKCYTTTYDEL
ncbi:hypothetical protein P4C99_22030 [Pontiellaceae bacterium B1224]|nr:hypothetical protein [Pontiellaceae bacterium B1224]